MKTSLVITLLNEEETIELLLESIRNQKKLPDEIVIVDGGSTDATVRLIRQFIEENKILGKQFKLLHKPGNRSIGRNYGVEHSKGNVILFTDAGCLLDIDWIAEVVEPFENEDVDVVAGYYKGQSENNFQKALIPYVLVMPDKVNPQTFLPATRSMAIRKTVFEELGGFDENLSHNEDYAFAKNLLKNKKKILFVKQAIVYWIPRNTVRQTFTMFSRFAYGDIEAGIVRPKVIALFGRYSLGMILIIAAIVTGLTIFWTLIGVGLIVYIVWSIQKNYRYVKVPSAFLYLPMLQFVSDIAVMKGSIFGAVQSIQKRFYENRQGYTKDAVRGVSWIGSFRIVSRVISFLRTIFVARLLNPTQFGLFGIVAFVLSFTEIITETGINILLIQEKNDIKKYFNTAFVVSILRGVVISVLMIASAPIIASFYENQQLTNLLFVASVIPLIRGFINPAVITFLKELNYRKEFNYRLYVFSVESIFTLLAVYLTRSPMGMVVGLIVGAVFEVLYSFIMIKPRPQFSFDGLVFRKMLKRGKWLTSAGIFNYLYHNGDDMVVGKILGASSLGIYQMAYKLSMLPITEVGDIITRVTFPVFTKFADDKKRLTRGLFMMLGLMTVIVVPMGIILFAFPSQIISIVLGKEWLAGAAVLQVLAVFGVVRAVSYSTSSVFLALKRQDLLSHITLISLIGMGITIIPFVMRWGLVGAGLSVLFGTIIALPFIAFLLTKLLRTDERQI